MKRRRIFSYPRPFDLSLVTAGNGITGKLPTTFSNDRLPDLRVLGLSLNLLTGTVTSGLLSMSNLEILLIRKCVEQASTT